MIDDLICNRYPIDRNSSWISDDALYKTPNQHDHEKC